MKTRKFQKLKALCLSAILIISFLIEGNGVVSMDFRHFPPTDGGTNTIPHTIRLFGTEIKLDETETSVSRDGITHTETITSHGVAQPSNTVDDFNDQLYDIEDAPRKKINRPKGREGHVQEEALEFPNGRRTSKEGQLEGSSAAEKSDLLSNTALKNPRTQPLPPTSSPGNSHDSESIVQVKGRNLTRDTLRDLQTVGESYVRNWEGLKKRVNDWVSNVKNILQENSLKEGIEGSSTEQQRASVHKSLQTFMNIYLGLVISWNFRRWGHVDAKILNNPWISEEKYVSRLKLSPKERPKNEKKGMEDTAEMSDIKVTFENYMKHTQGTRLGQETASMYTYWYDWVDPKREIKPHLSKENFNAFIREIHDFGFEKLKCKAKIGSDIQEEAQKLDCSEASQIAERGKDTFGFLSYEQYLIGQGKKVVDKWKKAAKQKIAEQLKLMKERIEAEVDSSEVSTQGEGRKRKHRHRDVSSIYQNKGIKPLVAIKRVEEHLLNDVLPAFFGLVDELNRNYGKGEKREFVLNDCLNYLINLISRWNEINYGALLDQKITLRGTTWISRGFTGLDHEELFWNGAFHDNHNIVPTSLLLGLLKGWVNTESSEEYTLKNYLASRKNELTKQFSLHLKASYDLAQIFPSQLGNKGPNKSQSVPFDFMSNVPRSKRTTRMLIER